MPAASCFWFEVDFNSALASKPENPGLGSKGVWDFVFNDNLFNHEFQTVRTYILIDLTLMDRRFNLPNFDKHRWS